MKYIVYILLAAIVASLGTGLYYLRGDNADSAKMLRALQFRVALSLVLIIFLRVIKGHFTPDNHFAFEAVAWYWHFVDVVWIGLYVFVYWL